MALFKVTASSEHSAANAAFRAFNEQDGDEWATNGQTTNYWIQVELPRPIAIHAFRIMGRSKNVTEGPSVWKFQASNDGSTWTDLFDDNRPLEKNIPLTVTSLLNATNPPTKYIFYRMYAISSTSGSVNPGLAYLNIFEYISY